MITRNADGHRFLGTLCDSDFSEIHDMTIQHRILAFRPGLEAVERPLPAVLDGQQQPEGLACVNFKGMDGHIRFRVRRREGSRADFIFLLAETRRSSSCRDLLVWGLQMNMTISPSG